MHFWELPTNAVVFLHLPGRPALVILLDITDRKAVQIIIFYDDIIPLGRQHSPLINRSRFESTALEHGFRIIGLVHTGGHILESQSRGGQHSGAIRTRIQPFGSLASLLHLLDRFPSRFVRMGVQQHTELLGKVFQRICITVSFDIHQIRHGTLSANLAGEALEQILAGADREFLRASALGAFANIILAGFSQFPEILHNVKQPAVRR